MSIRMAKETDLEAILAIYAPYVTDTTFSFEYTVPSTEEFTQRFRTITAQFPWLVWEESGKVLGYAYGSAPFARAAYQWCAASSIYLCPEAQGKGIAKQLYGALEALLKQQGYQTVYAIITTENTRSIDFHTAAGYQYLALFPNCGFKFGRWHGIIWMEKRLTPVKIPSDVPASAISICK